VAALAPIVRRRSVMTDLHAMVRAVPMPDRVRQLPVDPKRRVPVPWFVAWVDGVPDFRVADKLRDAIRFDLCWVCGQHRGRYGTFVIGPMCAVNRTTAEPPCHADCAEWSARVCPFLTRPHARRRENNMPDGHSDPAGIMIRRNPGVTLLWTTREWRIVPDGNGGRLFSLGDPTAVAWWAEGRNATRAEVLASIDSGMPILRGIAEAEGPRAVAELDAQRRAVDPLVPVEAGP
jgi:hypothetical protein